MTDQATPQATLAANTLSGRYTELPKTIELIELGVTPELVPTFHALTDYVNNQTGECFPMMKTIARTLRISVRTVQRHLHQLADLGLLDFVRRIRDETGRYRGYVYRLAHVAQIAERRRRKREEQKERERQRALEKSQKRRERHFNKKRSTGHGRPVPEDRGTSTEKDDPPNPPAGSFKEGYEWFFGEDSPPKNNKNKDNKKSGDFKEGYEWFFK